MGPPDAHATGRTALAVWLALLVSIACWPLGDAGIGEITTVIALLPLLAPIRGMTRGRRRTFGWAPLTLAPALAMALTEVMVNEAARMRAAVSLALILMAFAVVIATLRATPRG